MITWEQMGRQWVIHNGQIMGIRGFIPQAPDAQDYVRYWNRLDRTFVGAVSLERKKAVLQVMSYGETYA